MTTKFKTKFTIIKGDITEQDSQAIVNAANSSLMGGGGVDGAIHRKGGPQILAECKEIVNKQGQCVPGEAVITSGGKLKAAYVIHTVGPIWRRGNSGEAEVLRNAYYNCLQLARLRNIKSLAFPSISTGAYKYPWELAAQIALETIIANIKKPHFTEVKLVLFNEDIYKVYVDTYKKISGE